MSAPCSYETADGVRVAESGVLKEVPVQVVGMEGGAAESAAPATTRSNSVQGGYSYTAPDGTYVSLRYDWQPRGAGGAELSGIGERDLCVHAGTWPTRTASGPSWESRCLRCRRRTRGRRSASTRTRSSGQRTPRRTLSPPPHAHHYKTERHELIQGVTFVWSHVPTQVAKTIKNKMQSFFCALHARFVDCFRSPRMTQAVP